jgi:hypothetical protein
MKPLLSGIYYSFPVQLVLLHFKKFQVLLLFWYILFSTINGSFMNTYGADSLFLAPEYMGDVNAVGSMIMGIAIGIFVMSWNITTFILFSRHFRFLATTTNPFLKYCINNSIIPLVFLIFYFFKAVSFARYKELMTTGQILFLIAGFLAGLILLVFISFVYFFRADKTIIRKLTPVINNPELFLSQFNNKDRKTTESRLIKVDWYLNSLFSIRMPRNVTHYSRDFLESIFNRHHFAAVVSIFIAFLFLILIGFYLDSPFFQLPAAAGITIFFAILIAVSGAFSYFLQSWSIAFLVFLLVLMNTLYHQGIIDPSNKAYGLNYTNKDERPVYDRQNLISLCTDSLVEADKQNMIQILDKWKEKQQEEKPKLFVIATSGGGNRSANFTMNVLRHLDSLSDGTLMDRTVLITGASGGMLGASYYRELARNRSNGINPLERKYVNDIAQDLLNPLFTSFVARDLAAPAQKFTVGNYEYLKDRGYAFEQKLNANTRGLLNKQLRDFVVDEKNARTPLMFFNSVVTRDGRKLIISTQPVRFLMKPVFDTVGVQSVDPDAIDYQSFFAKQDPMNLRVLSALRMNATFPYVLPNVWLPTQPVVDVMDAGLRDNYGPETALRFLQVFRDWIEENTSGVVMIQIRDRKEGGWEHPYTSEDISEIITKPFLLLQHNWYKMQEYNQNDMLSFTMALMGERFDKITFQYIPKKEDAGAALNFHLTKREMKNIYEALGSEENKTAFKEFSDLVSNKAAVSGKVAVSEMP